MTSVTATIEKAEREAICSECWGKIPRGTYFYHTKDRNLKHCTIRCIRKYVDQRFNQTGVGHDQAKD